jgi:hypothetical protein
MSHEHSRNTREDGECCERLADSSERQGACQKSIKQRSERSRSGGDKPGIAVDEVVHPAGTSGHSDCGAGKLGCRARLLGEDHGSLTLPPMHEPDGAESQREWAPPRCRCDLEIAQEKNASGDDKE